MEILLRSTNEIVELKGGITARVWEGKTKSGIMVNCLITSVAVAREEDCSEFDRELVEKPSPAPLRPGCFDSRML